MKLAVSYLEPGMVLGSPVYSGRGELLLSAGRVLTSKYIKALRRVGVLAVHIQGMGGLDMEESEQALSNEVKIRALNAVEDLIGRNMARQDYQRVVGTVQDIIDEILSGKVITGGLAEITAYDSYASAHSVDVSALSIAIGHRMELPRDELVNLGVGSMLHDLGKTRIPLEIINKPGKLTDEEFELMKKHPIRGFEIASYEFETKLDDEVVNIILNHHERYDGSGYPRGLKGDELSLIDMICSAADMYNAMTTDRPYREAIPYSEAYEMLLGSENNYFTMDVVEAFAKNIIPYPVGTFVEMSDGQKACVIAADHALPTRPVVKIMATGEIIDLSENFTQVIKSQLTQKEARSLIIAGRGK